MKYLDTDKSYGNFLQGIMAMIDNPVPSKNQNYQDASKEIFDNEIKDKHLKKSRRYVDKDNSKEGRNKIENVSRAKKNLFSKN